MNTFILPKHGINNTVPWILSSFTHHCSNLNSIALAIHLPSVEHMRKKKAVTKNDLLQLFSPPYPFQIVNLFFCNPTINPIVSVIIVFLGMIIRDHS